MILAHCRAPFAFAAELFVTTSPLEQRNNGTTERRKGALRCCDVTFSRVRLREQQQLADYFDDVCSNAVTR